MILAWKQVSHMAILAWRPVNLADFGHERSLLKNRQTANRKFYFRADTQPRHEAVDGPDLAGPGVEGWRGDGLREGQHPEYRQSGR